MSTLDPTPTASFPLLTVPDWAFVRGAVDNDIEAVFLAGAALNSLDNLVCGAPIWAGAWRQRLALKCAAAAVSLAGRTESEAQICHAWHLRASAPAPAPPATSSPPGRGSPAARPTSASRPSNPNMTDEVFNANHTDGDDFIYPEEDKAALFRDMRARGDGGE